ncbi:MAG: hypothetical protein R3B54_19180 [Bdellovibrionota bacterium]
MKTYKVSLDVTDAFGSALHQSLATAKRVALSLTTDKSVALRFWVARAAAVTAAAWVAATEVARAETAVRVMRLSSPDTVAVRAAAVEPFPVPGRS